jgi:hypothetical protein
MTTHKHAEILARAKSLMAQVRYCPGIQRGILEAAAKDAGLALMDEVCGIKLPFQPVDTTIIPHNARPVYKQPLSDFYEEPRT